VEVAGNVVRIVAGIGGLVAASWLAVRTARARKAEKAGKSAPDRSTSYLPVYGVLVVTALLMVATVPLS